MTDNESNNLVLNVKDFGPIAEAKDIEIKPMTVFVGPSNTGKSYLAILLHAVLSAKRGDILSSRTRIPSGKFGDNKKELQYFQTLWSEIRTFMRYKYITNRESGETDDRLWSELSDVSKNTIRRYARTWLQSLSELSESSIQAFFEIRNIDDLRTGTDLSSDKLIIELTDTSNEWIIRLGQEKSKIDLSNLQFLLDEIPMLIHGLDDDDLDYQKFAISRLLDISISSHMSSLADSMYFPAARTGIMTGHRVLTDSIVQNASEFGIDRREIVPYNRVARDFLRYLINITDNEHYFIRRRNTNLKNRDVSSRISEILETTLIDGNIEISKPEFGPSEFQYSHHGIKLPMFRSSSMVTEIAPIILFLRNYMEKDDLLIIEEPEAHMHPAAQQKMAAALALMVRNGLRVLITTHSYDMVEQIGTLVNASYADESQRHGIGLGDPSIEKDIYLNEDEVGMYGFTPRDDGSGTDVIPIEIDQDYAYSPRSFSKALSDQFNRNSRFIKARIDTE